MNITPTNNITLTSLPTTTNYNITNEKSVSELNTASSNESVSSLTMLNDTLKNIRKSNKSLQTELAQKTFNKSSLGELSLHSSQISMDVNKASQFLSTLSINEHPINSKAREILQSAPRMANINSQEMISHRELWQNISNSINDIDNQYLKVYEYAVSKYTSMYQEFSDVLSELASNISPGKDGNNVKLDWKPIVASLEKIKSNYSNNPIYPSSGTVSEEQANKWSTEFGQGVSTVTQSGSGWVVNINMTPIEKMIQSLENIGGSSSPVELDNAKYQAWNAGFTAEDETMKNSLQTLVQKYSNANSIFDNLVKVLSSTISSCTDTDKMFLQF